MLIAISVETQQVPTIIVVNDFNIKVNASSEVVISNKTKYWVGEKEMSYL